MHTAQLTSTLPLPRSEVRIQAVIFESLWVRSLKPAGAFAEALRAKGFDVSNVQVDYPTQVFFDCMEVTHRHVHPGLGQAEARRQLGRTFVAGFGQTVVGRVVMATLPMFGPVRVLKRVPEYLKIGNSPNQVISMALAERDWRIEVTHDGSTLPEFVQGIVEEALARTRTEAQVEVLVRSNTRFDLRVRWADKEA